MEYINNFEIKEYIHRFDQILCEMSNKMLSFNITSNITINFLECMIPHHEAAICMCDNLLTYTNYEPLYEIANNIIKNQTNGVIQMKNLLRTTMTRANMPNDVTSYENKYLCIVKNMVDKMKNSERTQNINYNFTSKMIPHHEGSIQMCNNLLQYPVDPKLIAIANSIINEQTKGIVEFKKIQEELCGRR